MKPFWAALGRLACISSAAFGIATTANYFNYRAYWYGTIFAVQTVDFNILSKIAPTKLSYSLMRGDRAEIQRTLNSNYGLFGIVVTDCKSVDIECRTQKILYATDSKSNWRKHLTVGSLANSPFDYLSDPPPPLLAEGGYASSGDRTWRSTARTNKGQIIGRVYYVRGIPPTFGADYQQWMLKPWDLNGAHKHYGLTTALFLTLGITSLSFIEWLLYRKRIQQRQLKDQLERVSTLIAQKEQLATHFKNYGQEQEERIQKLSQAIVQLEGQLSQKDAPNNTQVLEQAQASWLQQIQQQEQEIAILQQQIVAQNLNSSQDREKIAELSRQFNLVTQQKILATGHLEQTHALIAALDAQVTNKEQERREMEQLVEMWRLEVESAKQREALMRIEFEETERSLLELERRKKELEAELGEVESPDLNEFEQLILDTLQATSQGRERKWLLLPHIDVSQGKKTVSL